MTHDVLTEAPVNRTRFWSAVLLPLAWPRYRIGRIEGVGLLAIYGVFAALVIARGGAD